MPWQRRFIDRLSGRTLGLAFVDPQGFEVSFRLFQILATRRIDVLFLFPSHIGIVRNLGRFAKTAKSPMDELWGGKEWRDLLPAKLAAGKRLSSEEMQSLGKPWGWNFSSPLPSPVETLNSSPTGLDVGGSIVLP